MASKCVAGPSDQGTATPISRHCLDVEDALVALLKEKVEDHCYKTRADAVKIARRFSKRIGARPQLLENKPAWQNCWKDAYTSKPENESASGQVIGMIVDSHSIVGWTTSNVLRRFDAQSKNPLPEWAIGVLQGVFRARDRRDSDDDNAIRWRVVHTLGAFPEAATFDLLLNAFNDRTEYAWVRYGCARSLIEIAVRTKRRKERKERLNRIVETCVSSTEIPEWIVEQIGAAALNCTADKSWSNDVSPSLCKLRDKSDEEGKNAGSACLIYWTIPPSGAESACRSRRGQTAACIEVNASDEHFSIRKGADQMADTSLHAELATDARRPRLPALQC